MNATEWLTLGLLVVTAVYACLTLWLANTTAKQVWTNNRAQVVASLTLHQGGEVMHLRIKNVGRGTAKDLRLSVDKEVQSSMTGENLKDTFAFSHPIRALPPESEWHFNLGQPHDWLSGKDSEKFPKLFSVAAQYFTDGKIVREVNRIDIEALLCGPKLRSDEERFYNALPISVDRQTKTIESALKELKNALPKKQVVVSPKPWRSWSQSFRARSAARRP